MTRAEAHLVSHIASLCLFAAIIMNASCPHLNITSYCLTLPHCTIYHICFGNLDLFLENVISAKFIAVFIYLNEDISSRHDENGRYY